MDQSIFGINIIDLLSFAAGGAFILIMVAVYQTALVSDPMKGRMKSLMARKDALRAGLVTTSRRKSPITRVDSVSVMRQVANKLKLLQTEQTKKLTTQLAQAGFRSKDALVMYQIARLCMPFLAALLAVGLFYGLGVAPDMKAFHPLFSGAIVLLGFKLPDLYVANTKTKRVQAIQKALPDALDLLVVCAEAGLTLDSALTRVAKETARTCPELADELELATIELGFLPERRQALLNLSERVELASLRGVVTALIQSERFGTPLATALRVLSNEYRNERLLKAEEKAARLPATLTVPLIVFILPILFVVLLGPAACQVSSEFISKN